MSDNKTEDGKTIEEAMAVLRKLLGVMGKDALANIEAIMAIRGCLARLRADPGPELFEATIDVVSVHRERVSVPARCPHCDVNFSNFNRAFLEVQLDWALQEVNLIDGEDVWGRQEHGGTPLVLGYECGQCGKLVAGRDRHVRTDI